MPPTLSSQKIIFCYKNYIINVKQNEMGYLQWYNTEVANSISQLCLCVHVCVPPVLLQAKMLKSPREANNAQIFEA